MMIPPAAPVPTPAQSGLMQRRWPLALAIAVLFAVGQVIEALLFAGLPSRRLLIDVVVWGGMSGLAVWAAQAWVARRERPYLEQIRVALAEQQRLVSQLQRSNTHLLVLSSANKTIADALALDALLEAAIQIPQRLVPAQAVVGVVQDSGGQVIIADGRLDAAALQAARARFQPEQAIAADPTTQRLTRPDSAGLPSACLLLPLRDGAALLGWLEVYGDAATPIADDELDLLETIAAEFAEAIVSMRRRVAEERAWFHLEQAIMEERARIARDIHDGIAQTLAFRRMRIDLWLDWLTSEPDRLREELVALKQVLRDQIAELRRAIFALRPMQFEELGFIGGLQRYLAEFAGQHGWRLDADLSQVPATLPPEIEAMCFRIVQEAVNNAAKHAQASAVAVVIEPHAGGLRIAVRDNGRGLAAAAAPDPGSGLGLRQIRERLAVLQGWMMLETRPDGGAALEAWFPFNLESQEGTS